MKQLILISILGALFLVILPKTCSAQITGNKWVTGGSISSSKINGKSGYSISASPFVGVLIWHRLLVGLSPETSWSTFPDTSNGQSLRTNSTRSSAFGFTRLFLSPKESKLQYFGEITGGYSWEKWKQTQIDPILVIDSYRYSGYRWGIGAGFSYWIVPRVSLDGRLYFLKGVKENPTLYATLNAAWSVSFWFGKKDNP